MISYDKINFSSGLSFFLLRPYYSDFANRLIKDPVALTGDLVGSHSRAVIVSGEMTNEHFKKYIYLTGSGLIVYPPPKAHNFNNTLKEPTLHLPLWLLHMCHTLQT